MATLRVKFPRWPGWNTSEYLLTSTDNLHMSTEHLKPLTALVDYNTTADYSSDSPVLRATLQDSSGTPMDVALKFAFREDLTHDLAFEAEIYNTLFPLQKKVIPHCYGLYTGIDENGLEIAALVLEYWGKCISQPFHSLGMQTRIRILKALEQIHRCGLTHGDFAERNVLIELDGDVRIIDFDMAQKHECSGCDIQIRPGARPDARTFGCAQLYSACDTLNIWETTAG